MGVAGVILHDPALGMSGGFGAEDFFGALGERRDGKEEEEEKKEKTAAAAAAAAVVEAVSFTSDEYDAAGVRAGHETYHCRGAFHGNFVDAPLWAPSWVMRPLSAVIPAAGPVDPSDCHASLARAAARFMEGAPAASLGEGEPLFEPRGRSFV